MGRSLRFEPLEDRALLSVTVLQQEFQTVGFSYSGTYSGGGSGGTFPYDWTAQSSGTVSASGSITYADQFNGVGTVGAIANGETHISTRGGPLTEPVDGYTVGGGFSDNNGTLTAAITLFENGTLTTSPQGGFSAHVSGSANFMDGTISGSSSGSIACGTPDLSVTSAALTPDGSVLVSYANSGGPIATSDRSVASSTVTFYWASGTSVDDILGSASLDSVAIYWNQATGEAKISGDSVLPPPDGATHLLVVVDADGLVTESNETNNLMALQLPRLTGPTVTINQASGQADPANGSPINFTVVFNETVTDFATGDVTLSGTAGATTAVVSGSGTTYNVAVSGMTGSGTVIAGIAADKSHDAAGNPNEASTSSDNSVIYNAPESPSLIVTTATDVVDASDGLTSLREAVAYANSHEGDDTITFDPSLFGQTITLTGGQLDLTDTTGTTTITGLGTDQLTVSGNNTSRVFHVGDGVMAAISCLTIANGSGRVSGEAPPGGSIDDPGGTGPIGGTVDDPGSGSIGGGSIGGGTIDDGTTGGGIFNIGTVTITDCTISANSAFNGGGIYNLGTMTMTGTAISENTAYSRKSTVGCGGGIYNSGTLTMVSSTIAENSAAGSGGGILNAGGRMTITYCTICPNSADNDGGGILNASGTVTMTGSAIVGNTAAGSGGGICNRGTITLTNSTIYANATVNSGGGIFNETGLVTVENSTIAGNSAVVGGGILNGGDTTVLSNTIVADNNAGDSFPDIGGGTVTANYCLIEDITNVTFSGSSANNLTGIDPLLGTLGDNGGLTQTIPLLEGSPAIDAGSNALIPSGVTTDQRGYARIINGTVEIGAYESAAATPETANITINDVSLAEGSPSGTTAFTFTVSLSNPVASDVTVDYATADGTATTADNDYTAASGTVTFTAGGALTQTVTVNVTKDTKVEADETFFVNLSNAKFGGVTDATRAAVTDSQGVGTIINDDTATTNTSPTISGVTIIEETGPRDGTLTTRESIVMTFNALDPDGVTSATLQVDGKNVTPVYGPYVAASGVNFGVLLGALPVGTHNYSIVAIDKLGNPTAPAYAGTFDVVAATNPGPTISGVMVVEETGPRNGTLTTSEILMATFNAVDPDGVVSATLQLDGKNVTPVYGPYTAASGVNFGVLLGKLSAGTHHYSIVATDKLGNPTASAYAGTFDVVAAMNAGPTISGVVVVSAQGVMTWNAVASDGVASVSLTVDGTAVSKVYGPYAAASGVNFAGDFGTLSAGSHNYVITATDMLADSSQYSGSFSVAATTNPGPTISGVVLVPAQGVMTWNTLDSDGVASTSLTIDGTQVSKVYGPYTAISGVNFAGVFGTLSAGNHNYVITATDMLANSSQYTGTFNVAALTIDASARGKGTVPDQPSVGARSNNNWDSTQDVPVSLTDQQFASIVTEAERRLATLSDMQVLAAMASVKIQVADLPDGLLGEAVGKTILIDRDAAGYGWFVDSTPADDLEFAGVSGPHSLAAGNYSPAAQRVDLLTTVMHEMGHVLGYEHSGSFDLMSPTLSLGTRRSLGGQPVLSIAGGLSQFSFDENGTVPLSGASTGAIDQVFASFHDNEKKQA